MSGTTTSSGLPPIPSSYTSSSTTNITPAGAISPPSSASSPPPRSYKDIPAPRSNRPLSPLHHRSNSGEPNGFQRHDINAPSSTNSTVTPTAYGSQTSLNPFTLVQSGQQRTTSWLNALSDGLSWIEVQGGQVVANAANGGLGETLRGVGAKRPLSFSGLGGLAALGGGQRRSIDGGDAENRDGKVDLNGRTFSFPGTATSISTQDNQGRITNGNARTSSNLPSVDLNGRPHSSGGVGRTFGNPQITPKANALNGRPRTLSASVSVSSPPGTINPVPRKGPPQPANFARLAAGSSAPARPISHNEIHVDANHQPSNLSTVRRHRPSLSHSQQSPAMDPTSSHSVLPRSASSSDNKSTSSLYLQAHAEPSPNRLLSSSSHVNGKNVSTSSLPLRRGSSSTSADSSSTRTTSLGNGIRQVSGSSTVTPASSRSFTPYKPGFQPQGVRHDRTEEYEQVRKWTSNEREKEEGRLTRRWGKLIDIHFNPNEHHLSPSKGKSSGLGPSSQPTLSRSSSIASQLTDKSKNFLSMEGFDKPKAKDVWRGIRSFSGVGVEQVAEEKKREAEMAIVKWEEDGDVKRCRICESQFSISNRKHHCRLCGRIVCSLPPTSPSILSMANLDPSSPNYNARTGLPKGIRREKCSFLLVADWRTGRGQFVEDDFVGWMKLEDPETAKKNEDKKTVGVVEEEAGEGTKEVMVKGVRACRECWAIVSRKQKMDDRRRMTSFSRTYETLKLIEREISDSLPELQEMMMNLNSSTNMNIPADVIALHKHLVTLFQQYDTATRRIKSYPCEPDSGQAKLQSAIARACTTFVTKEAPILQILPRLQRQKHKRAGTTSSIASGASIPQTISEDDGAEVPAYAERIGLEEQVAMQLQPLLEQEAQIEEYLKEANKQRKFEDATTLKASLEEIREEIARLAAV